MTICVRCGNEVNAISSLFSFNKETKRCKNCDIAVQQAPVRFRSAFLNFTSNGILTPEKWQQLLNGAHTERLDIREALLYIRGDSFQFVNRFLNPASSNNPFDDRVEQHVYYLMRLLNIQGTDADFLIRRVNVLNIYRGRLPIVQLTDIRLDSDEICHMAVEASYHKMNKSSTTLVHGRLVATNKKLRFLSSSGGVEISWNSIMSINQTKTSLSSSAVYLELSKKAGNGLYSVIDADSVVAIVDTLVRVSKRQLINTANDSSRHIPQDVKIAVWQKDKARCIQCGATDYLEFDHIIPFSKGGASTVNNVQLLCRRCNQAKGDKI